MKKIDDKKSCDVSLDGIGIFDGFFLDDYCDDLVKYFEFADKNGYTVNRQQKQNPAKRMFINDKSVDFNDLSFLNTETNMPLGWANYFLGTFWGECYPLYVETFSTLEDYGPHQIFHLKIQKTCPSEGYHIWHSENMRREVANRILVFTLYLNDVDQGGETEFLFQKRRVTPKKGRLVIWPPSFLHTHRGNPPLSGDKYIVTGWSEL